VPATLVSAHSPLTASSTDPARSTRTVRCASRSRAPPGTFFHLTVSEWQRAQAFHEQKLGHRYAVVSVVRQPTGGVPARMDLLAHPRRAREGQAAHLRRRRVRRPVPGDVAPMNGPSLTSLPSSTPRGTGRGAQLLTLRRSFIMRATQRSGCASCAPSQGVRHARTRFPFGGWAP
jgi:hypothetical protein